MKKLVALLFVITISTLCLLAFSACAPAGKTNDTPTENDTLQAIYGTYVVFAEGNGTTPLSYEEWLESVKGKDGADGASVTKAEINNDGYLVITLSNGNTLIAGKVKGEDGTDGTNGTDGISVTDATIDENGDLILTLSNGQTINAGKAKGEDGANGTNGSNGENGVSVTNAAINENGELIITLSDGNTLNAGKVKDVHTQELTHTHEIVYEYIEDRAPTCTSVGLTFVVCQTCKELLKTVVTDKAPHDYEDVVVAPTCTEQGYTVRTCKVCGYTCNDFYVEPTGHTYAAGYTFDDNYHWHAPTCGHTGVEVKEAHVLNEDGVCTACGYNSKATLALRFEKIAGKEEYALTDLTDETVKTVYIPETYDGLPVTAISDMVFYGNTAIETVIMADTITEISARLFYQCSNLKTVHLSESLTEIPEKTFYDCYYLSTVDLPDGVTSIGSFAFWSCSSLTSVTIGNGVTSIGEYAFDGCSSLTSITIPDGVTSIGEYAFSGCNGLTSITVDVDNEYYKSIDGDLYNKAGTELIQYAIGKTATSFTIPDSVTSIGNYAFSGCRSLTSVIIPDGVTSIGNNAFEYCRSLTSVIIGDGVTSIGRDAFSDCPCIKTSKGVSYVDKWLVSCDTAVTSVKLNEDTKGIAEYAFYGCSKLTSIDIPDSVTSIGDSAFCYCSSLTSVTIGDGVSSIGNYAFYNCSSLTSVTIPDGVRSISYYAFNGCSSLTSITIPDSVTSIGSSAFSWCESLTSVYYNGTISQWVQISGLIYLLGSSRTIYIDNVPLNEMTEIVLENVAEIKPSAFRNCSSLTSITIPDGVTSIGSYAFNGCSSLTSITIPDGVTSIDYGAFSGCSSLTSVTIPDSVTSIGNEAFDNCSSLTSVTIPDSVTSIGRYAFEFCSSLTKVYYKGTTDDWTNISIDSGNSQLINATKYYYSETEPTDSGNYWHYVKGKPTSWSDNAPLLFTGELEYSLNADGESYSVKGIGTATDTDIIIPSVYDGKPVTNINDRAFSGCSSLTSITIPDSVTSIGSYAFSNCRSLTSIDIPDSVTKVGELAFYDCGAQSEIDGFYVVDDWVFDARSFPSTVIIPEGIVGIADYTFSESGVESATFPSTLKYVGYASFWDSCLKYISFENPDVIINSRAFSQTFLNKIDYNGTTKQWLALNYIENSCESYKVYCTDGILNRDGSEHLEVTPNEYFTFTYIQATNSYSVKIATTSMPEIVVIPSEYNDKPVTQIASSAFSYSYNIKRIVIPDSITIIGDWAFCDCVELENINIPDGVTIIGSSVFEHCYKLANVQIPFGVESIGLSAFRYCYLSSIEIPDSVTDIGEDAFYNCSNLTSVTIGNGVTSIGRGAFDDCSSLTSVTIGDGVTSIGDYAFYNCSSLTSIDIPDSVTSIGNSAFYNCSSLTSVTIGNGVTSIDEGVFRDCSSLTSVTIGNSVESIGNYAFSGCTSLTSITIPDSVTSIGYEAFYNCSSLTNVTIGNGVTSIGERAFSNCSNLSSVTIGRSVNSIGNYAFDNCKKLLKVYYNGTAQDWYNISIIEPYNSNCYLSYTTRYYYSETQPTASGNYWHYDGDGNVVEW